MRRLGYAIPRQAPTKRWVTLFALLAFFLQSLAVQTHIHPAAEPAAITASAMHVPLPAPLKAPDPIDQCRLCQELVHAGTFVTPSAAAITVELTFVAAVFVALPAFAGFSARAFAWRSRAPPR